MSGTREGNHFKNRLCYTTKADIRFDDGSIGPLTLYKRRMTLQRMILRYADTSTPEAKLWCAVLTRAVKDFATPKHRHEFWTSGTADIVCRAVNLHPDAVRRWAKRLKLPLERNIKRIARTTPP